MPHWLIRWEALNMLSHKEGFKSECDRVGVVAAAGFASESNWIVGNLHFGSAAGDNKHSW
jgi:hypothetical protein